MCAFRSICIGWLACLGALLATAPQPARAASDETAQGEANEWAEEGRNALSLFLGATTADGESDFSAGLDYERRLSRRFGIGGVIEFTRNDFRERIVAVSLYWIAAAVTLVLAGGVAAAQQAPRVEQLTPPTR